MDTIIKKIRVVVVSNLVVLGLAACSSTPAPWTQQSNSPWGEKHAAEAESISSDESVTVAGDDPVMLDEQPIVMAEPMAEATPAVLAPVIVAEVEMLTPEEEVLAMSADSYAIQVYASKTTDSVNKFKADKDLANLMTIKTDRSGLIVYVLIDVYPDKSSANAATAELEAQTGSKPWVRSIAGLQKIVAQ